MFIIYDTETTGLIDSKDKIIQLAYAVYDEKCEPVKQCDIVFNDGSNERDFFKIIPYHRIRDGIHPASVVNEIYSDFSRATSVVSYSNSRFDERFMNQYFKKYGLAPVNFIWINIMDITAKYISVVFGEKSKNHKLGNAYSRLFNLNPVDAHTATGDVVMLIEILELLINKKIITHRMLFG
jgi:DNA polymerase III alpha subunit (gram-positive type)